MDYHHLIDKFNNLGLFIQDLQNNRSYPNQLWDKLGHTEEDMRQYGFLEFVHPDDRDRIETTIADFISSQGHLTQFIFRIRDKKNQWHWVVSSCLALENDDQGNILTYAGIDHEITDEVSARERAEKALKEAETLRSANAIIASELELPQTIAAVLEQAERVISFSSASVQLLETEGKTSYMRIAGGIGFPEDFDLKEGRFPLGIQTPNSLVIENREALILDRSELIDYPVFIEFSYADIQCWMGIPLIFRDRVLGMIAFDRLLEQPFTEDDLRMGQAFADQVAIALENARLFEETKRIAVTDALTGCFNRRWMFIELEKETESALRHGHDLSLIMFDVDDFKLVNDTYGHLMGDKVLKEITRITQKMLRTSDTLCRSGGEEFIIVLPHTGLARAVEVADRVRLAVEESSRLPGMEEAVTVSMGCVLFTERDRGKIDEFISRADKAMYRSKRAGKNKTTSIE